jgi:hypothetical protein
MTVEKEWTILIYANGNNDLEPEIHQSVENIKKAADHPAVNVVIELGRAPKTLVKLLRNTLPPKSDDTWHGVRRYLADQNRLILLKNLKARNMASPECLLDFIKWGIRAYPAKRYMLIVGGHGYQFVGTMTDYTQNKPYIMGLPEMVKAIDMAGSAVKRKIDVVLLDICYFNFIEVMYELGKNQSHTVQSALTYVFKGPIAGLPYHKIIDVLQEMSTCDTATMIRTIINDLSYDLAAFSIDHELLNKIKERFNQFALELEHSVLPFDGSTKLPDDLSLMLFSLVLHFKKILNPGEALIAVAKKPSQNKDLIARYYRLGFAQHNHWTHLLSSKTFAADTAITEKLSLGPLALSRQDVYAFISLMNPEVSFELREQMLAELYRYKNWN